jgi:hypothetical protein
MRILILMGVEMELNTTLLDKIRYYNKIEAQNTHRHSNALEGSAQISARGPKEMEGCLCL